MADWNSLIDDPLFNAGLGLLGGASTGNPWGAAADQLNKYQALRQNREYQRMHAKVYEAQARKAEQEAQQDAQLQADWQNAIQTEVDPERRRIMQVIGPQAWSQGIASQYFEKKKRTVVAPGSTVLEGDSPIFTAPDKPEATPEFIRAMRLAGIDENSPQGRAMIQQYLSKQATHAPSATVRVENYPQPMPAINPQTGQVELTQFGTQGTPRPTGFAPAPQQVAPKEPTFDEKKAAGFLGRMERAESILQTPSLQADQVLPLGEAALRGAPLTGGKLAPYGMSQNRQQVRQAQEDWVRAKLRPESGAAIPNDEMEREIQLYFPQPGENNPAIIQQKAQARRQAVEQMRSMAGRAPIPASVDAAPATPSSGKTVVRRVRLKNGKTGIEYSDGTRVVE